MNLAFWKRGPMSCPSHCVFICVILSTWRHLMGMSLSDFITAHFCGCHPRQPHLAALLRARWKGCSHSSSVASWLKLFLKSFFLVCAENAFHLTSGSDYEMTLGHIYLKMNLGRKVYLYAWLLVLLGLLLTFIFFCLGFLFLDILYYQWNKEAWYCIRFYAPSPQCFVLCYFFKKSMWFSVTGQTL